MSLFVSDFAFGRELIIGCSKIGILAGSALCSAVGYYVLRSALELEAPPSKRATAKGPGRNYIGPPSVCILKKEETA